MDKDYICGCGKSYGSYPAFSTHRKTKHNNVTVPGTLLPSQQKAKRGRPSCDFKKLPQMGQDKKNYYQGLNIIQYGLLDLQEKYKGKIISQVHEENSKSIMQKINYDYKQNEQYNISIQHIEQFLKHITIHMQAQAANYTATFFQKIVQYGLQHKQLNSIQVFNNFCVCNMKQLNNAYLGINFYIEICLLLSKWMCVMGYSKEILRAKNNGNVNDCKVTVGDKQARDSLDGVKG